MGTKFNKVGPKDFKEKNLYLSLSIVIIEETVGVDTTQIVEANDMSSSSDLVSDAIRETLTDVLTGEKYFYSIRNP